MFVALVRYLCTLSLALLVGIPALRAGHDLFTQLVVSESKETGLARLQSHVSVGIPIPASANASSITNLVVVGATETQYSILSRWPSGAIHWLLLDAIIDLPKDSGSLALQLTNGQAPPSGPDIATETENEILLNTGDRSFVIPKSGTAFLSALEVNGTRHPAKLPFKLTAPPSEATNGVPSSWDIQIAKNGPVQACVEFTTTINKGSNQIFQLMRLTATKFQSNLQIELSVMASPSNSDPVLFSGVGLVTPFTEAAKNEPDGRLHFTTSVFHNLPSLFICDPEIQNADIQQETNPARTTLSALSSDPLRPGALRYSQCFLETAPNTNSITRLGSPLIGRATSIETYNDGLASLDKLLPFNEEEAKEPPPEPSSSFEATLPFLKAINEGYTQYFTPAKRHLYAAWKKGIAAGDTPDEGLALWPLLTGDRTLLWAHFNWAKAFVAQLASDSGSAKQAERFLQLPRLLGGPLHDEVQPIVLNLLNDWLISPTEGSHERRVTAASRGRLMAALYHLPQKISEAEIHSDSIYDLLENLLSLTPKDSRGDHWFAIAYQLTGDPKILTWGQEWLDGLNSAQTQNLQHLITAPLRYSIWRPLTITPSIGQGPSTQIEWTVPTRAERYRIKFDSDPIKQLISDVSPNSIPFSQATNADSEPLPNKSGRTQFMSLSLPPGPKHFISGRYLERGAALPAPEQQEDSETLPESEEAPSTGGLSRSLLLIAALTAILAGVLTYRKQNQAQLLNLLLLCALAGGFIACKPSLVNHEEDVMVEEIPITTALTDQGNYRVTYEPSPNPVPLNEHFEVTVEVLPVNGEKTPVQIEVHADMPAHGHGINTEPGIQETGDGTFEVKGILFHMKGDWELYVDILKGPIRERATFPISLH